MTADLTGPGYVVLVDRFDPNWHARIDSRELPVLRANQLFRALHAEPGQHVFISYYRQQGLLAEMLASVLTLLLLMCIYMRDPEWPHVSRT